MLGVPLGAGAAHVVQFGPVGVLDEGVERADKLSELAGQTRRPAAVRARFPDLDPDVGHDALLAVCRLFRRPGLLIGRSCRAPGFKASFGPISLKFGRNSPALRPLSAINVA